VQGCQILLDTSYQNSEKYTKVSQLNLIDKIFTHNIPNDKNPPTFSILKPSKIYPNWDFWFENIPSGNHAVVFCEEERLGQVDQMRL
jgi:hypothetical protein